MEPHFVDLVGLMTDIDYDWNKIGVALEVENHVLSSLHQSNDDNMAKLITVLETWMDTCPVGSCTWYIVVTAVEGPIVKRPSIAMKIRQFLAKPEVQSKYGVTLPLITESVTSENKTELGQY